MKRPDIAYDARLTSHMSVGMQQYARELRTRIPKLMTDLSFEAFGSGDNFDLGEQVAMPLWMLRRRPRLVHLPSPFAPFSVPVPYVVTIHDLIDLHYPQWTKPKARWYFRTIVRRLARHARTVITDDESTAEDIVRFYAVDRNRIAVIPLGIDAENVAPVAHGRPYVMYAGNRRPHKNLGTLLEGWRRVDPSRELDLVLTGGEDPQMRAVTRERGRIVFLGELQHAGVLRWIAGASALVHAALREGFGLPLLEAASLGTPVVVAEGAVPQPLRSVVRTFRAEDAGGMALAIEAALSDRNGDLTSRARAVAAGLTWDLCARRTIDVYRRCL